MSNQETLNLISVRSAIESYTGFTQGEKSHAINNLDRWAGEECDLNKLTKNFETLSLDAKPFLEASGFLNA